jgi:hypothetical protein
VGEDAMARPEGKIDEELVCIDSLVQRIRSIPGSGAATFRAESDDPPDFWLNVDAKEFAVEVTAVTTGQAYMAQCDELFDAIKEGCHSDETWKGIYSICFFRQPEIPKRKKWKQLVTQACSTIASLVSQPAETDCTLLSDGQGHIRAR